MEALMSNRTIKHEIKLQPSVIILFGLLVIAACVYVFAQSVGGTEMIVAQGGERGGVWHLKDGEVRVCFPDRGDVDCSSWSED